MSAIFGIINLDGRPVAAEMLDCMRSALSHCGPDGSAVWRRGHVALGHQMMHVTPESLGEKQPLCHAGAEVVLSADARLDYRETLLEALGVPPIDRAGLPDSVLILKAYDKWGEACPAHLDGDFAFAIWDGREQKLLCVSDPLGMRPIYYHQRAHQFVFASEIKGILAVPGMLKRPNKRKIASLIAPVAIVIDKETTFFDEVLSVPPATVMRVRVGDTHRRTYWAPTLSARLTLKTPETIFEAFQELWFQAVATRLRSAFPVAMLLSGGLDSSAMVATAARILKGQGKGLTAVAAVPPEGTMAAVSDGRDYIDVFRHWENVDIDYVTDAWRGPFDALERLVWSGESPIYTSRHYLHTATLDAARRRHARSLFDGRGGEFGPSFHGTGYLAELLLRGRWYRLVREVRGQSQREALSLWRVLKRQVLRPLLATPLLPWVRRCRLRRDLDFWQRTLPLNKAFVNHIIGAELPHLLSLAHTRGAPLPNHRANQLRALESVRGQPSNWCVGYEHITRIFPFCDKRVIEFCLAAPGDVKVRDGWKRYLIRAGLETVLPREIQWRTTKDPFGADYHRRYHDQKKQIRERLLGIGQNDFIREMVDVDKLQHMLNQDIRGDGDQTPETFAAMHTIPAGVYLSTFLQQFDQ